MGVELVLSESPELAGQKLLDSLPDGAELETTTKRTKDGWVATACVHAPWVRKGGIAGSCTPSLCQRNTDSEGCAAPVSI